VKARGQAGFTYLGLIIFVAIIGLVGAAMLKIGSLLQRAAAEEELLDIGAAFSAALDSYAAATPRGASPYPPSLAELLKDPRSPAVRRHLRKVYVDPLTGKAEWGIVYLGGGETGVVAIHSLSAARPLKVANFDSRFKGLDNKATISEWRFSAGERSLAPAVTSTQSGGPGAQPAPPVEQPAPPVEQPAPPVEQPAPPSAPAVEEPAPPEPAGEESEAVDRE
jgi:type II secretory pathway pseudopilin PulG